VDRRLTATQALEHAWVRPGGTAPDRPLEGTVVRAPLRMPHPREPVRGANACSGRPCMCLDRAGVEGEC